MVQVFIKEGSFRTLTLELYDNYTISIKELMIKVMTIFLKEHHNIDINNIVSDTKTDFFSCMYFRIDSKNYYFDDNVFFNTNDLKLVTIHINYVIRHQPALFDNKKITIVKNILTGYY